MKRTRFLFILLTLLCPFGALAGEAIVNSEVTVDVTAKDAEAARAQALAKAEIDGVKDLLNKLAPAGQADDVFMTLDSRKINKMVKGTEVLEEKISGNRYQARLLVSFDADLLSAAIGKISAQSGEELPSIVNSFLIIPAYQEGESVTLWEDGNPWRNVWKSVGLEASSGDMVVPYGDAKDMAIIDTRTLSSATFDTLVPLTLRYGVTDIVILHAKLVRQPDLGLSVIKRRVARGRNEINLLNYRADPQETREMLLARAARDVADGLQKKKSEEVANTQAIRGGEKNKMMLLASISTLASWTELRTKLSGMPMIDRIELLAMAPKQVDMIIHYRGTPDSLARAIEGEKIRLIQNKDYWVISRD